MKKNRRSFLKVAGLSVFALSSGLGSLATKNSASGSYTPAGSVSQPTFTGSAMTSTGKFTPEGTV